MGFRKTVTPISKNRDVVFSNISNGYLRMIFCRAIFWNIPPVYPWALFHRGTRGFRSLYRTKQTYSDTSNRTVPVSMIDRRFPGCTQPLNSREVNIPQQWVFHWYECWLFHDIWAWRRSRRVLHFRLSPRSPVDCKTAKTRLQPRMNHSEAGWSMPTSA